MTTTIIISLCVLLLLSYLFDFTASKTKIPSVILLLLLGWFLNQLTIFIGLNIPDFSSILPVLGTIGLILIVLEGSLELKFRKSNAPLLLKSLLGALIPMVLFALILAFFFYQSSTYPFKQCLINAIPLSVISSAIAIPSVRHLSTDKRSFVIYESSFSDILGVLFFNFIAVNETISLNSFGTFSIELLVIVIISIAATIGLSFLLSKIKHHIKFVPIILLIILVYEILKIYHLPGLIFILMFGLVAGNLDELQHHKWVQKFRPEFLKKEVIKFTEITIEAAFIIRSLFFLLFGFLISTAELLNQDTIIPALGILILIFMLRAIQLYVSRLPLMPLLFVAPRGLITILLFLSIEAGSGIGQVNKSLIIQVIALSAISMMLGFLATKNNKPLPLSVATQSQIHSDTNQA